MRTTFAERLLELRHIRGISQKKVAADLIVQQQSLSAYERGLHDPGITFLCAAADYYGVPVSYLLGRETEAVMDEKFRIYEKEKSRIARESKSSEEYERRIRELARRLGI